MRKKPLGGGFYAIFFAHPKKNLGVESGFTLRERRQEEARHEARSEE